MRAAVILAAAAPANHARERRGTAVEIVILGLFIAYMWWANSSSDKESKGHLTKQHPDKDWDKHFEENRKRRNWTGTLAIGGAFIGSFVGIAAFGGAIAGTVPGALVGAYIGFQLGSK